MAVIYTSSIFVEVLVEFKCVEFKCVYVLNLSVYMGLDTRFVQVNYINA